jgi:hypothetical protein
MDELLRELGFFALLGLVLYGLHILVVQADQGHVGLAMALLFGIPLACLCFALLHVSRKDNER